MGIVEEMSGVSWTFKGRAVFLNTKTEIDPDMTVGEEVKTEGILDNEGSPVTREINGCGLSIVDNVHSEGTVETPRRGVFTIRHSQA